MPSEQDRSEFVEPLPARPNLEMQHKRAKALLRAAWAGNADALKRILALHPKMPAPDTLKLADAQLVVARGRERADVSVLRLRVGRFLSASGPWPGPTRSGMATAAWRR